MEFIGKSRNCPYSGRSCVGCEYYTNPKKIVKCELLREDEGKGLTDGLESSIINNYLTTYILPSTATPANDNCSLKTSAGVR